MRINKGIRYGNFTIGLSCKFPAQCLCEKAKESKLKAIPCLGGAQKENRSKAFPGLSGKARIMLKTKKTPPKYDIENKNLTLIFKSPLNRTKGRDCYS